MKPKLIIFEGVDKSGKTSLKVEFNNKTNYRYWVLDRSIISSIVYDSVYHRDNLSYLEDCLFALKKSFNLKVILCTAEKTIIESRLEFANETLPNELKDISKIQKLFKKVLDDYIDDYIVINTKNDISSCISDILNFVEA